MHLITRRPRHRAVDRAAALDTECRRLKDAVVGMNETFDRLRTRAAEAEIVAACTLVDLDDVTVARNELAAALARIDDRHAEVVEGMQREIDDLWRRLEIGAQAEAAATETQAYPVITQRFEHGSPIRLGVALNDATRQPA